MHTPTADPFLVGIEHFQGPLDLLLHLIRKQDIDIFDIPISRITEQFLGAIRAAEGVELARAGEFVEMAATLVRIKAQMLFPGQVEDDEEDPRAELVRRLLEYESFREAAGVLGGAERDRARYHHKGYLAPRPHVLAFRAPLDTEWAEVWAAALQLAERLAAPAPGFSVTGPQVRIEEKFGLILDAVGRAKRVEFASLVAPWGTRMHAVMSLLACLELTKRSSLRLRQSAPFAPLWLYPRTGEEAA